MRVGRVRDVTLYLTWRWGWEWGRQFEYWRRYWVGPVCVLHHRWVET